MTTPRRLLVDPQTPLFYHLVSRCVRRGWLCGYDPISPSPNLPISPSPGKNYTYRKQWILDRLAEHPERIAQMRHALGCLSYFMQQLKQPIARRANLEDDRSGHFFEQRFYSGALLDESAVIATLAYVDLNPIRAQIAKSMATAHFTSAQARLVNLADTDDLNAYLAPVMTGLPVTARLKISVRDYIERLEGLLPGAPSRFHKRRDQVAALKRRQRAYGARPALKVWIEQRGLQMREVPLPG